MSNRIEEQNTISGERKKLAVLAGGGGVGSRNPHLAEMLKQEREPVDYQIVNAKVDAKLMAQEANEAKDDHCTAGEIVSKIGPLLMHKNKERDYGWSE